MTKSYLADFQKFPNVVGVGKGRKVRRGEEVGEAVVVLVTKKLPLSALSAQEVLPSKVDGMDVDVIQAGHIIAHDRKDRWDPLPGGVSIGHYRITAGTLACYVRRGSEIFILSNNHVLANSNDAQIGDNVLQPGAYDGGVDVVAHLSDFVTINFGESPPNCPVAQGFEKLVNAVTRAIGSSHRVRSYYANPAAANIVDAAIAKVLPEVNIDLEILDIGQVTETAEASLGMDVKKSGRTTGFTTGKIQILDTTVQVDYGAQGVATFENQIVTSGMSQPGDSGSLLVSDDNKAVGLLFAGSDQITIHCRIQNVLTLLGVTL